MRPRAICCWLAGLLLAAPAPAQPATEDAPSYSKSRAFQIPFRSDPSERRIQTVWLHVSEDFGRTWLRYANAPPDQKQFKYQTDRDGQFWFAVQTIDQSGQAHPPTMTNVQPGLKVIVDTQPPSVILRPAPVREGQIGVEWDVRDDNLDTASMRLEQRLGGNAEWQVVGEVHVTADKFYWNPGTNSSLEVRLRARDKADNWNEAKVTIGPGGVANPTSERRPDADPRGGLGVRILNSRRISLDYKIEDQGPSGIAVVELWYTTDGRNWQKYKDYPEPQPPIVFDVNDEGLYGFTMIARSKVGLGERPPQPGDPPHIWVEVDETKPAVRLSSADVGRGSDLGNLTIIWAATDKNLARQPISLSYSEKPDGPWNPIAAKIENTGRYIWKMPPTGIPYSFLIRVEAVDRAGNVGMDQTPPNQPVIVDLSQPKVKILAVEPAINSNR